MPRSGRRSKRNESIEEHDMMWATESSKYTRVQFVSSMLFGTEMRYLFGKFYGYGVIVS